MSPEELQDQVTRSEAINRELREQVQALREELAEARRSGAVGVQAIHRLKADLAAAESALAEAREEIARVIMRWHKESGESAAALAEAGHTMKALRTDKEEWKGAYNRAQRDANEAIAALAEARGALREARVFVVGCGQESWSTDDSEIARVRNLIDAALDRAGEQETPAAWAGVPWIRKNELRHKATGAASGGRDDGYAQPEEQLCMATARLKELGHAETVNEGESCCVTCDRAIAREKREHPRGAPPTGAPAGMGPMADVADEFRGALEHILRCVTADKPCSGKDLRILIRQYVEAELEWLKARPVPVRLPCEEPRAAPTAPPR